MITIDNAETSGARYARPVEVKTTVTSIEAGLQFKLTADIIIREIAKGALSAGNNNVMEIGITDGSSFDPKCDVMLDSSARAEVVEGDLKIKNQRVRNGILRFEISSESTSPSIIKISKVAVKVNDYASAESNDYPYNIIVGGSAILSYGEDKTIEADGIAVAYLKIV